MAYRFDPTVIRIFERLILYWSCFSHMMNSGARFAGLLEGIVGRLAMRNRQWRYRDHLRVGGRLLVGSTQICLHVVSFLSLLFDLNQALKSSNRDFVPLAFDDPVSLTSFLFPFLPAF